MLSFLPRFPELDETAFELDLLPSSSLLLGLAEQDRDPPRIRLRPARSTNMTREPSLEVLRPILRTSALRLDC